MAEIDTALLSAELDIVALLAVQVVLAIISLALGYASGRGWARIVFPVALALAAVACGGTLYRCVDARVSVRGRLAGRVPGPHLSAERAENHLSWVAVHSRLSIGIAATTSLVGGLLYYSGRRGRHAEP